MLSKELHDKIKSDKRIQHILYLLDEGKLSEARNFAIKNYPSYSPSKDLHIIWGNLFEDMALPEKAKACYQKALKICSYDPYALSSLAKLLYEIGDLERSMKIWRKLASIYPDREDARNYLLKIYKELGLHGSKKVVSEEKEEYHLRYFPPDVGKSDTETFLRLFLGNERGFFEQELDSTGKSQLIYVKKRISQEDIRAHILSEKTIFYSFLSQDKKVKSCTLYVKIPKKEVYKNIRNISTLKLKEEKLKSYAKDLTKIINGLDVPAYLEMVNEHLYRIWIFFDEFVHFLLAKRFLKSILKRVPIPEMGLFLGMLLPTEEVGVGWMEKPVLLPLGVERTKAKRSLFLDEDGEPFANQLKFLKKVMEFPTSCIRDILKEKESFTESKDKDILELKERCPVVGAIIDKALQANVLKREEKVILIFTVGLLDPLGKKLHKILFSCPDYNYQRLKRELKNVKPNPISCLKIKEYVPDLAQTFCLNCAFDLRDGRYPSPLLHIKRVLVPTEDERLTLKHKSPKELLRLYVSLDSEKEKIERKIKTLKKELLHFFLKKNITSYKISDDVQIIFSEDDLKVIRR